MNELRQDPVTGRQVIVATHRDARPNQFVEPSSTSRDDSGSAKSCPFCYGQMDTPPIVAHFGGEDPWQVCAVPNLYPIIQAAADSSIVASEADELLISQPVDGFHEVVIESPTHVTRTGDLSVEQFQLMLHAYRDRVHAMHRRGSKYVQVMKNSGRDAGASLLHSHSQIFGLPFVPDTLRLELQGATRYFDRHQCCVYCDLIARESEIGSRIVGENEKFVAWCPYASRFGYETWIAPRAHASRFEDTSDLDLEKLGTLFQEIVSKIEQHARIPAFNYLFHSLPFDSTQHDQFHWHIEIIPRIAKLAGFEWGTGVHVNTVAPEDAARDLRIR